MNMIVRRVYWILSQQVGIDLVRLARFAVALPWYCRDALKFKRHYEGEFRWLPCLHDKREQSGAAATEYFSQDLHVAQQVFQANPKTHVDIGSRIDGFIAHVATFRTVTVIDIRPNATRIPNVEFLQADLMEPPATLVGSFDSLSCLHTLEHFGLGRYGDPIDPQGYIAGLRNMARLVAEGGTFYLAVPVGRERVEFNAHRVFHPRSILAPASDSGLSVTHIVFIDEKGHVTTWNGSDTHLDSIGVAPYALAVFTFRKKIGRVEVASS